MPGGGRHNAPYGGTTAKWAGRGLSVPEVLARIRAAEQRAGRPAGSVRLVAVTKEHSVQEVERQVLSQGLRALGENRGQELRDKVRELAGHELEWHFIGPVQRNKAKYLRPVTLVHTIEDASQAEAIARLAGGWGRAPDLLLQVHNGEPQKHGCPPEALGALYHQVSSMGLTVRGLMVMAPYGDPDSARRVFAETARHAADLGLMELSMGMSDDFETAIEHGATLVRVGRRLFVENE